jgi:hypothetical protein
VGFVGFRNLIIHGSCKLELKHEEDMWYLYAGMNLEMAFETLQEAEEYLAEEGFISAE